jgi:hypothetical protein
MAEPFEGGLMNNESVSMRELELENAELLPTRETLCVPRCYSQGSSGITEVGGANGSFLPILSGNNININVLGIGF